MVAWLTGCGQCSWKGDALQKILDTNCHFTTNCSKETGLKLQSISDMNKCTQKPKIDEDINSCTWATLHYPLRT